MVSLLSKGPSDEQQSQQSLARGADDRADLDTPYERAREKRPVLDRLRSHLIAQPDEPAKIRALAWLDDFTRARELCIAEKCRPRCAHPFRHASGKSRPDRFGSERPLATAVPA